VDDYKRYIQDIQGKEWEIEKEENKEFIERWNILYNYLKDKDCYKFLDTVNLVITSGKTFLRDYIKRGIDVKVILDKDVCFPYLTNYPYQE
jgi:hypothetical protein